MYVCDAGSSFNRFENDFEKNNITLKCLPDNKFEEDIEWPTCLNGNINGETKKIILFRSLLSNKLSTSK